MTLTNVIETIGRIRHNGWAPARWSHHPAAIKELIHAAGFRPKVKACYDNCGKLMLAAWQTEHAPDLRYCEGLVHRIVSVPHAWVRYRGEVVDLTVTDGGVTYEQQLELTPAQLVEAVRKAGRFGPFASPQLDAEAIARLHAMNAALAAGVELV